VGSRTSGDEQAREGADAAFDARTNRVAWFDPGRRASARAEGISGSAKAGGNSADARQADGGARGHTSADQCSASARAVSRAYHAQGTRHAASPHHAPGGAASGAGA
jgi:hypothetical protein